jgi:hypothetical protein
MKETIPLDVLFESDIYTNLYSGNTTDKIIESAKALIKHPTNKIFHMKKLKYILENINRIAKEFKDKHMKGGSLSSDDLRSMLSGSYEKNLSDAGKFTVDKDLSGKRVKVYHNPETKQTVVSHRGTANMKDWLTDAGMTFGYEGGKRFKHSKKVQKKAEKKYGTENLTTVGHSLGARLAEKYGQKGNEVITLNKPIIPKTFGKKISEKQYDIRTENDPVSALHSLQKNEKMKTIKSDTYNPLTEHSVDVLKRSSEIYGKGLLDETHRKIKELEPIVKATGKHKRKLANLFKIKYGLMKRMKGGMAKETSEGRTNTEFYKGEDELINIPLEELPDKLRDNQDFTPEEKINLLLNETLDIISRNNDIIENENKEDVPDDEKDLRKGDLTRGLDAFKTYISNNVSNPEPYNELFNVIKIKINNNEHINLNYMANKMINNELFIKENIAKEERQLEKNIENYSNKKNIYTTKKQEIDNKEQIIKTKEQELPLKKERIEEKYNNVLMENEDEYKAKKDKYEKELKKYHDDYDERLAEFNKKRKLKDKALKKLNISDEKSEKAQQTYNELKSEYDTEKLNVENELKKYTEEKSTIDNKFNEYDNKIIKYNERIDNYISDRQIHLNQIGQYNTLKKNKNKTTKEKEEMNELKNLNDGNTESLLKRNNKLKKYSDELDNEKKELDLEREENSKKINELNDKLDNIDYTELNKVVDDLDDKIISYNNKLKKYTQKNKDFLEAESEEKISKKSYDDKKIEINNKENILNNKFKEKLSSNESEKKKTDKKYKKQEEVIKTNKSSIEGQKKLLEDEEKILEDEEKLLNKEEKDITNKKSKRESQIEPRGKIKDKLKEYDNEGSPIFTENTNLAIQRGLDWETLNEKNQFLLKAIDGDNSQVENTKTSTRYSNEFIDFLNVIDKEYEDKEKSGEDMKYDKNKDQLLGVMPVDFIKNNTLYELKSKALITGGKYQDEYGDTKFQGTENILVKATDFDENRRPKPYSARAIKFDILYNVKRDRVSAIQVLPFNKIIRKDKHGIKKDEIINVNNIEATICRPKFKWDKDTRKYKTDYTDVEDERTFNILRNNRDGYNYYLLESTPKKIRYVNVKNIINDLNDPIDRNYYIPQSKFRNIPKSYEKLFYDKKIEANEIKGKNKIIDITAIKDYILKRTK